MTNYYIRSINPDGSGEVVETKMKEPLIVDYSKSDSWLFKRLSMAQADNMNKIKRHIASLPCIGIASPELAKQNGLGWVRECEIRYECFDGFTDRGKWEEATKEEYENNSDKEFYRIVLDLPTQEPKEETVTPTTMSKDAEEIKYIWEKSKEPTIPIYIDAFRDLLNQYDKEEISMSRFVEALNVMAWKYSDSKVQEERQKGWVSVEDRYPARLDTDKNGCLLGWDKFQEMAHKCKLEDIHQMKMRFTHWMPLPEPPKQ